MALRPLGDLYQFMFAGGVGPGIQLFLDAPVTDDTIVSVLSSNAVAIFVSDVTVLAGQSSVIIPLNHISIGSAILTVTLGAQSITTEVRLWDQASVGPTDITISGGAVNENAAAGTVVATLSSDSFPGDTFAYSINGASPFVIVGNEVRVAAGAVLDFETLASYSIDVVSRSNGGTGGGYIETIPLTINNLNEAPSALNLSFAKVAEFRANGSTIGTFSSADPDGTTAFTYSLLNNAGGRFAIVGNKLRVADGLLLDYEQKASHVIQVRVTDAGGKHFTKNFTITLTDINPENLTGTSAANTFFGGASNDTLSGAAGADILRGYGGEDILIGGLGRDTMTGGTAHDDFDFNSVLEIGKTAATRDVIVDFKPNEDHIDLHTIDANTKITGNQGFSFIVVKDVAFSGVAGALRWIQVDPTGTANDRTIIEGDINGDKIADFQIELIGLKTLTANDFVL